MSLPQCTVCGFWHEGGAEQCPVTAYNRAYSTVCRCCGADLAMVGHHPACENLTDEDVADEPEDEWEDDPEDDWEGGDDFDPYSGCEVFDRNEGGDDGGW